MRVAKNIKVANWKALNDAFAKVTDAIDANEPIEGAGIRIEETGQGKIISRTDMSGAGNQQPNWVTITVVDPDTCVQSQLQVWARNVSS